MAGAKEIRTKIASVKSTQKITSAMEMVAASKMRKAQDRMESTRPYAEKMRQVIGHVALANPAAETYLSLLAATVPGDVLTHLGHKPLSSFLKPEPAERPRRPRPRGRSPRPSAYSC